MTSTGKSSDFNSHPLWAKVIGVFLIPFGFAFAMLFLAVAVSIGLLFIPPHFIIYSIKQRGIERRFRKLMHEQDRFLEWSQVERQLKEGNGTFILEQGHKRGLRCWWTSDNILEFAPCDHPDTEELNGLTFSAPHEFTKWCHRIYCNEKNGVASYTKPDIKFPPGLFFAEFVKEQYPASTVIDTLFVDGN